MLQKGGSSSRHLLQIASFVWTRLISATNSGMNKGPHVSRKQLQQLK